MKLSRRCLAAWTAGSAVALVTLAVAAEAIDKAPHLHGRVLGPGDRPLTAVRVRLYVDGAPGASTWADSTGAYSLPLPGSNRGANVMAWFFPVDDELVPECVLIGEGPLADSELLSCVPRLARSPNGIEYSLTLLDTDGRLERLRASPCFEQSVHVPAQEPSQ